MESICTSLITTCVLTKIMYRKVFIFFDILMNLYFECLVLLHFQRHLMNNPSEHKTKLCFYESLITLENKLHFFLICHTCLKTFTKTVVHSKLILTFNNLYWHILLIKLISEIYETLGKIIFHTHMITPNANNLDQVLRIPF